MKQASTEAYAKINLTLDVTGKRPNGYHDVCMVMQSIGIHDIVTVQTETGADDIELTISHCDLPFFCIHISINSFIDIKTPINKFRKNFTIIFQEL